VDERLKRRLILGVGALVVLAVLVTASLTALRGSAEAAAPAPLRIAVVGDYYTVGTQNDVVWPTLLAESTGWAVTNSALPGAGYAADGRGAYAFTYQVDRALAAEPDVVLIVGGTSDTAHQVEGIRWGASEVFRKVIQDGRRALVVGPTWHETPVPDLVTRVSDTVHAKADAAGAPFLGALDPPWLTGDLMRADGTGPTDAGQAFLAERIEAWIRQETGR
jgi:lysophospholipase L1-like esterase